MARVGERVVAMPLTQAIRELCEEGWFAVAEDLEDGADPATVLTRLAEIGEAHSTATEIVSQIGVS